MGFWAALGWWVLFTAINFAIRPRPRRGAPQPSSLGEFRTPTAEEGRVIPGLAGTALIEGPNVLWDGDYEAVPVIEGGQTAYYKYYKGIAYGLCLGPIDRVLDVRFDQKILTLAPFEVASGKVLRVEAATVGYDVAIPSGEFATAGAFAKAVTAAIRGATGDSNVRVVYGYEVDESDQIRFRVGIQTRTEALRGGVYSGPEMAATLNTAFHKPPFSGVTMPTASYDDGTGQFTIDDPPGPGTAEVLASGTTVLASLGFSDLADVSLPATGLETRADRFFFFLPAGVEIHWAHANTNCHALFGMSLIAGNMTSSSVADGAVASASPLATFSEFDGGTRVTVLAPNLFDGEAGSNSEGGIEGVIDVYHGSDAQLADDYLEGQYGAAAPAWPFLAYAVLRKLYWGTAPYMKNFSVVAERCPNPLGLTGDRHRIIVDGALGADANPACVIWELLTDTRWGMGLDPADLDLASFVAAAETLWQEGLGMSWLVDQPAEAQELLDELRRHIDGALYPDPTSGLIALRLVRDDYNFDSLPILDESVIDSVKVSRSAWEETINVLKVQYVDRTRNHSQRVLQIQNLANLQLLGRQVVEEIPFRAVSNPAAAAIVGGRALRTMSYPLGGYEIVASREAWRLRPVDVVRLRWSPLGISDLVVRATRVEPGEMRDNAVHIEAAEDPYGLDRATFVPIS